MTKRKYEVSQANSPTKKKKYSCKFNATWTLQFNCIVKSEKGEQYVFCRTCKSHFSVAHSGKYDVERHVKGAQHTHNMKSINSTPSVFSVFKTVEDPIAKKVTCAEVLFTAFIAEHDLSFNLADHFTRLVPVMFPDSEIARKFACGRTKTANIVNHAVAPEISETVVNLCKNNKFSLLVDESNDKGLDKCVAILIRVHDSTVQRVVSKFLAMPVCNIGTGANLFSCLQTVLVDRDIPWSNLIGYMSDNASVMIGQHNSVLSRIREKQGEVYDLGCVCHIANTCLSYALKKLPVGVEELLIDTYYYFLHSSKRKEEYLGFVEFLEVNDPGKLLKHCPTRWLSLHNCVKRTLVHWPALKSYFNSHPDVEKSGSRVQRCATKLNDEGLYLTYLFLEYILEPICGFNTTFQADESMVGYLHTEMSRFLKTILSKFVKMKVILSAATIQTVDFSNTETQHDNELLAVGMGVRDYLHSNQDSDPRTVDTFFKNARQFYCELAGRIKQKFPFQDSTLKALAFLNPDLKANVSPASVTQLGQRFTPEVERQKVNDEYEDLCLCDASELPVFKYGETSLSDYWTSISDVKLPSGGQRYGSLVRVAFACLSLPHSNAETERAFSRLRKVQTDYRGQLSHETVENLMSVKMNMSTECYNFKPSETVIKAAKKACVVYNERVSTCSKL